MTSTAWSSAHGDCASSTIAAAMAGDKSKISPDRKVLGRTRVLRHVSSIRELVLGPARDGERLRHFADQMGLPHHVVVAQFQVRRC